MAISTTKSVFQFNKEYVCVNFYDSTFETSGVKVILDDEELGRIIGITVPEDIDNIEENEEFDKQVAMWIVDNDK